MNKNKKKIPEASGKMPRHRHFKQTTINTTAQVLPHGATLQIYRTDQNFPNKTFTKVTKTATP